MPFATAKATDGSVSAEQRKWRLNLVSNYEFARTSRLRGWSGGTGARWQDEIGISYSASSNPDGSVNIDIAHPYILYPLRAARGRRRGISLRGRHVP